MSSQIKDIDLKVFEKLSEYKDEEEEIIVTWHFQTK